MKKIISALALCLVLVLAPYTVVLTADAALPWRTFNEGIPDVTNVAQGACAGRPIMVAAFTKDGKDYVLFAAENGRYVFAEMSDGKPSRIYVGVQLSEPDQDTIKIVDEHPYSEARDGDGPCGHLFPKEA